MLCGHAYESWTTWSRTELYVRSGHNTLFYLWFPDAYFAISSRYCCRVFAVRISVRTLCVCWSWRANRAFPRFKQVIDTNPEIRHKYIYPVSALGGLLLGRMKTNDTNEEILLVLICGLVSFSIELSIFSNPRVKYFPRGRFLECLIFLKRIQFAGREF